MRKLLLAGMVSVIAAAPAYAVAAQGSQETGAYRVAQVPEGATGGRSGGPNQSQAVIPEGATGGRSGGPNQIEYKKPHKTKKKHHH